MRFMSHRGLAAVAVSGAHRLASRSSANSFIRGLGVPRNSGTAKHVSTHLPARGSDVPLRKERHYFYYPYQDLDQILPRAEIRERLTNLASQASLVSGHAWGYLSM